MKQLSKELKEKLDSILVESKETMNTLDELDKVMFTSDHFTSETLTMMSAKATGAGNYLRKKWKKLVALARNIESNRVMEIKLDASQQNQPVKVAESAAQMEASAYIGPIRMTREILDGYVIGAENCVSFCRMERSKNNGYNSSETGNQVEV